MSTQAMIYLVDDDFEVREALSLLLRTNGFEVRSFEDGLAFLEALPGLAPACLIVDIRMPHLTGLRLQERLSEAGCDWPALVITGHGDIEACRRAFRSGAVDFLTKPIDETVLIDSVRGALALLAKRLRQSESATQARTRLSRLTGREAQILGLVAQGLTTKEIARNLAISPRTIETHRTHIGEKLGVGSVAEMVKLHLAAEESAAS